MFKYKQFISFFLTCMVCLMMSSCIDEELLPCNPDMEESIEGFSIGFTISLPVEQNATRSIGVRANDYDESYDNYIDTQNKFRILFFDKDGKFLFGAVDRTVTPLNSSDYAVSNWYVRVPLNYIVDREGKTFDVDKIKNKLKTENFKVAVLANWPNAGVIHPGDYDDDTGINRPVTGTTTKGEPLWGWDNSVLNPNASDVKNINDLHHLVEDGNYSDETRVDRPTNLDVYDFVMKKEGEKYLIGQSTDWVKMRDITLGAPFDSKETAEAWIRNNWDPSKDANGQKVYRHYTKLWQLWNFSGSNDKSSYEKLNWGADNFWCESWASKWYSRNIYTQSNDGWRKIIDANSFVNGESYTCDGLTFIANNASKFTNGNWVGIQFTTDLAGGGDYVNTNGHTPKGYFKFKAPATGTLRIKFGCAADASYWSSSSATIVIQRNTNRDKSYTATNYYGRSKEIYDIGSEVDGWYRDISITGESEDIYIFCSSGTAVIYSIEWICSKYLYDTDREAVMPSAENPIPMYGVQNFLAIGDKWTDGSTFDISLGGTKPIALIRSLAKVEVYIPTSLGEVSHIYMRSMNRTARCEPIDVETPTDQLWGNHVDGDCEWFDIQRYSPSYKTSTGDAKNFDELAAYTNWLSWYYGSWTSSKWTSENNNKWNFSSYNTNKNAKANGKSITSTVTVPSGPYPHLFNAAIERSDFTHMIYAGIESNYYKYVIYVPDKMTDDPNYPGIFSCIPKVPHIEFRIGSNTTYHNEDYNLDDNDCHRIYFIDYSEHSELIKRYTKDKFDGEESFEKNVGNLEKLWPIMRNHVYQFYLSGGSGIAQPEIKAKVKDWGYEQKVVEW